MKDFTSPALVLERFQELRGQVVQALQDGQSLASELPGIADAVTSDFEAANQLISNMSLSLMVVGAEGVGKSTLIRGLLGEELSPIEADQAGTVAPVYFQYGANSEPSFEIIYSSPTKSPLNCEREIFLDHIRQRTNENNHKGVAYGIVEIDKDILRNGLLLVDMPGTGGISDQVRREAQRFLESNTGAVIGIAANRSYGPLIDLAQILLAHENRVGFQAILSNRYADYFVESPATLKPLASQAVAEKIAISREEGFDRIKECLDAVSLNSSLTPEQLYVFSAELLYHRSGPIATDAHLAEIDRFLSDLAQYIRQNSLGRMVQNAARRAERALSDKLKPYVNLRHELIEQLLSGDQRPAIQFRHDANTALKDIWQAKYATEAVIDDVQEHVWTQFDSIIIEQNALISQDIEALIGKLTSDSQADIDVNLTDKVTVLRAENEVRVQRTNQRLAELLETAVAKFVAGANETIVSALGALPVRMAQISDAIRVTPEDVLQHNLMRSVDDASGRLLLKATGGAAGGAAGAGIASQGAYLALVPDPTFVTQTIGLIIGGVSLWVAVSYSLSRFFGSDKDVIIAQLRDIQRKTANAHQSREATLKPLIGDAIVQIVEMTEQKLRAQLTSIDVTLSNTNQEDLSAEKKQLEATLSEIENLSGRILSIRKTAFELSEAAGA